MKDAYAPGATLLGVPLRTRWHDITPDLNLLAIGLYDELGALREGRPWPIPSRKARLTRVGGRCPRDGTPLVFDPWLAHAHRCDRCGEVYAGREHDDWWSLGAQMWCAERTLHAALFGVMWERDDLLALARSGLDAMGEAWSAYPNQDNVLGPSRPFFSTYLESVWLLNGTLAAQALRAHPASRDTVDRFISRVVEPSRAIIATYPEGASNRQAWHTAAQLAAAILLEDHRAIARLIDGPLGVSTLISRGLLEDGTWYEGENYHLFAHRGLWYGVTMLESIGVALPTALSDRFSTGFRTPFLGLLPDGCFPSRRDSRYGVPVHQWRFAEWCELGLARGEHEVLTGTLHRLYHSAFAPGDTGRARSTADIERDEPPTALARASLGWRTLLFARQQPWPLSEPPLPQSVVLPLQGLNVLRRDAGRIYVALEGGHTGGGHGHPDRLALTLQDGIRRVLQDPGTGSYVDRALHWYRSTLAHNAPLVNGCSQTRVPAQLDAFDARTGVAWLRVRASGVAPGVSMQRTVVLLDEHVVDYLVWEAEADVTVDLPIHAGRDWQVDDTGWRARDPGGAGGLEDGFDFLQHTESISLEAGELALLRCNVASDVTASYAMDTAGELWRATAPGPPGMPVRHMSWLRARASSGAMVGVWSLRDSVRSVKLPTSIEEASDSMSGSASDSARDSARDSASDSAYRPYPRALLPLTVEMENGTTAVHHAAPNVWHIALAAGSARSSIDLEGLRAPLSQTYTTHATTPGATHSAPLAATGDPRHATHSESVFALPPGHRLRFELGQAHYRGSEDSWQQAGRPTAQVELETVGSALAFEVLAHTGSVVVPDAGAQNLLDNERADVNADGVQLYIGPEDASSWTGAWLIVPAGGEARVTPLVAGTPSLAATWQRSSAGWSMSIRLPMHTLPSGPHTPFRFDLIVNERPPHRARRRGQLVLSGSRGEFVYLRGDRHDPRRALLLQCTSHAHGVRA